MTTSHLAHATANTYVVTITALLSVIMLVAGVWSLLAPDSFARLSEPGGTTVRQKN